MPSAALGARGVAHLLRRRLTTSGSSSLSVRALAELEDAALRAARAASHPLGGPAARFVRGAAATAAGALAIDVAAPFPASAHAAALRARVVAAAASAAAAAPAPASAAAVSARLVPARHCPPGNAAIARAGPGLAEVGSVIAVSSCKGGVGKSTVAVNLAFALRALGSRVALLDSDIHGPSLPTMVSPRSLAVTQRAAAPAAAAAVGVAGAVGAAGAAGASDGTAAAGGGGGGGTINALQYEGVACMSYGWVSRRNERGERGGAAMRGPMVSQVVSQLLRLTEWGAADHLVVDMPPGTGDVQLTLGQAVPLTGAVIVTTPQQLAVVDVVKGLELFRSLRVPTLAVVLNMAHFDAPDTGRRYYPFGEGGLERVREVMARFGVPESRLFTLPLDAALSAAGDAGVPEVVARPASAVSAVYARLAQCVATGVDERLHVDESAAAAGAAGAVSSSLRWDAAQRRLVLRAIGVEGARETALAPAAVRRACRCAACVDELTGRQRLDPASVREDVAPTALTEQGNYAVAIAWSDGHASGIWTYEQLGALAAQAQAQAQAMR